MNEQDRNFIVESFDNSPSLQRAYAEADHLCYVIEQLLGNATYHSVIPERATDADGAEMKLWNWLAERRADQGIR
jgi:hypothetical protein